MSDTDGGGRPAPPEQTRNSPGPLTPQGRIWAYTAVLVMVIALLMLGPAHSHQPWLSVHVPWWALAIGLVVVQLMPAQLFLGRAISTYTATELPITVGLLCTSMVGTMEALAVAAVVAELFRVAHGYRAEIFKAVYNVAAAELGTVIGYMLLGAFIGQPHQPEVTQLSVGLVAATMIAMLSQLITSFTTPVGVSLFVWDRHALHSDSGPLWHQFVFDPVFTIGGSALAIILVQSLLGEPWLLIAWVPPTVGLILMGRIMINSVREERQADDLRALCERLLLSRTLRDASEQLLKQACSLFVAGEAQLLLLPTTGDGVGIRSIVRFGEFTEAMDNIALSPATSDVIALLQQRHAPLAHRRRDPAALRAYMSETGLPNVLVALISSGERDIALLTIGERDGSSSSRYSRTEVTRASTLAAQAGAVLENSRLTEEFEGIMGRSAELEHRAFHDPLTELPNRSLLLDRLGQALLRQQRGSGTVGVLYIDLDNFKEINDGRGHAVGDAGLIEVATRLRHSLRAEDTAARLGGDEFVVLIGDLTDPGELDLVAHRLLASLNRPLTLPGDAGEVSLRASIGAAAARPSETSEAVLGRADQALYRAKGAGKGRVAIAPVADATDQPPAATSTPAPGGRVGESRNAS